MVLYYEFELRIHSIESLKEKRNVLKSLLQKLRQKYRISGAEIGIHDQKSFAIIGVAIVGNDGVYLETVINDVIQFIEINYQIDIIDYKKTYL